MDETPRRTPSPELPVTWSNPQGEVLTALRDGFWVAERPFYPRLPGLTSTDVGGKMAVVRLPSGDLWVHSPVALDPPLRADGCCSFSNPFVNIGW